MLVIPKTDVVPKIEPIVSWTLQCNTSTTWSVRPVSVAAISITADVPADIQIDPAVRVALLAITPRGKYSQGGRLFIQIMPLQTGRKLGYQKWQELQEAVLFIASSTIDNQMRYWQVSDSGYTKDNLPGLRIEVVGWDPLSTIYAQVPGGKKSYACRTCPNVLTHTHA
jgi:hypothetical protein